MLNSTARLAALVLSSTALADIKGEYVSYGRWGLSGDAMGERGMTVESFESVNLAPGLKVQAQTAAGGYGPTGTLPNVFNPSADPFGSAFVGGAWDGTRGLINTNDNQSHNYNSSANWGDLTFFFDTPAVVVGFSVQQMDSAASVIINGVNKGSITSFVPGFPINGAREGYVIIRASGADTISSIKLDNVGGDGFVIDHLAFSSQAAPALRLEGFNAWGASDASIDMFGAVFENFEDTTIMPGLQVEWDTPAAHVGPTSTLPNLFDPVSDAFGTAFQGGAWEGKRGIIDTWDNLSHSYSAIANWGDVVLHLDPPQGAIGFSLEQAEAPIRLIVNGRDAGELVSRAGLSLGSGRQGYIRISADCGAPLIESIRLANTRYPYGNDGWMLDHVGIGSCKVDFNGDGFADIFDFSDFVTCFEGGDCPCGATPDFNGDGFPDIYDFVDFVTAFEAGC